MKQRISFFLSFAIILLFGANVFAQGFFEGTILMEMNSPSTGKMPLNISTKGDKSLIQIESPKGQMTIYSDRSANKVTMVMGGSKMGMSMPMNQITATKNTTENSTVTATGEKRTINGFNCELYTVTSEKSSSNWWMTADLPKSLLEGLKSALSNPAMSRDHKNHVNPGVEELFKKGLLPIQIETTKDGKVENTITFIKYDQTKLADALFVVPSDVKIMDMPSMGGSAGRE